MTDAGQCQFYFEHGNERVANRIAYILITVIQNIHFVIFLYIRCEKRIKYYEPNMLQVQLINTHFDLAAFVLGMDRMDLFTVDTILHFSQMKTRLGRGVRYNFYS